jgi:hypothetical protein
MDPICDDAVPNCSSKPSLEPISPATSPSILDISDSIEDTASSASQGEAEEELFSDVENGSASSNSCNSACCEVTPPRPLTYRTRVLAYLDFPSYFADEADKSFATKYVDNIFRYVVSRIPSLLIRARSANCPSVMCFFESDHLQENEFGRLWRGLKYNNVHPEGKLSVDAIRNALYDAESGIKTRSGPCVELLGGKIWKDAAANDLSRRGWDHFYRFVSKFGCLQYFTGIADVRSLIDELLRMRTVCHSLF